MTHCLWIIFENKMCLCRVWNPRFLNVAIFYIWENGVFWQFWNDDLSQLGKYFGSQGLWLIKYESYAITSEDARFMFKFDKNRHFQNYRKTPFRTKIAIFENNEFRTRHTGILQFSKTLNFWIVKNWPTNKTACTKKFWHYFHISERK